MEKLRRETLTLGETLDRLRAYHRRAPFLFFNGNTFATIGRELVLALFSDLRPSRKREVSSIISISQVKTRIARIDANFSKRVFHSRQFAEFASK